MKIVILLLVLYLVASAQPFYPSQDAYVYQYQSGANFGAEGSLELQSNLFSYNDISRSLVQFDLSSIPQGTPVISAVFHVYMYNQAGIDFDVDLHRVLAPWEELVVNWDNQPVHDTDVVATLPYQGYDWWQFDVADLVQLWVDDPDVNHGLKMKFQIEQYPDSLGRAAYFYSRDTTFNQPYLELALGVDEYQVGALEVFSLAPNPVSISTVLKIKSSKIGPIRVALYDIQGRLVRMIHEDPMMIGENGLSLDVRSIPTGTYLLKVDTENGTRALPLVIIR
ncbi:MAG: DNRLRE domain-containing protein [Chitinivibrionales bacterium]|nr:DNRLRE domain-containing protein [Chitinivibrionales bacterium]